VDKGALLAPAEFGYRFRHYVAELGATRFELAEWKRFSGLRFEIQIRTVLEHAWAAIDHALRYKREADVPREQKRVLFRLSALLELADENFDSLKRGQTLLSQDAENRIDNRDDTLELNIVTYAAYARTSIALQDLANLMYSAGFRRPEELDLPPSNDDSHAIAIAQLSGIRTISDLDGALNDEKSVALKYFTALVAASQGAWHASPDFAALLCIVRRNNAISKEQLIETGFDETIADRVLAVANDNR